MGTIHRRPRTSRRSVGPYKTYELLTGEITYPVQGYTGYGDGVGTNLAAFISEEMRLDWEANKGELLAFWSSGAASCNYFPDGKPWLFVVGNKHTLPWAAKVFDDSGRWPAAEERTGHHSHG